jgi:hypothetical protein
MSLSEVVPFFRPLRGGVAYPTKPTAGAVGWRRGLYFFAAPRLNEPP